MVRVGKYLLMGALAVLAGRPTEVCAQAIDPGIQQQIDQYVIRPSGDQLIIKSTPEPEKSSRVKPGQRREGSARRNHRNAKERLP